MMDLFNNVYYVLNNFPLVFWILIILFGLVFGSFLNLVIYRLPIMLENESKKEFSIKKYILSVIKKEPFNLAFPASHCPHCKHKISVWHNIPIVSFLWLRGKCFYCKSPIPIRYLLVEVLSCLVSILVAWQWGITWQTVFLLFLTWALIALAFIDVEHFILPDIITIPFLWIGLIASLFDLFVTSKEAILGAVLGYLFLWIAAKAFKIIRGIEGMGFGDFKLLALFGAWCGWQLLPIIILLSAILAVVVGGSILIWKRYSFEHPIPFGPFIAVSGWVTLMWHSNFIYWQAMFFK